MHSSHTGRRRNGALASALLGSMASAALLAPAGFIATASAFQPPPGTAAAASPAQDAPAQEDTPAKATYSAEQAERGKTSYERYCVECHGEGLHGGLLGGPPLSGVRFNETFAGPASTLFLYMSSLMPPESPGRYSPTTYANIMAYILQVNGYPEGEPLPADVDALNELMIEK